MILTDQQIAPIDVQARRAVVFGVGDTVRVHQKIQEKDKTRIQVFEGTVIARKHGIESGATFTVRRVGTDGVAVEKIFPLYTPTIDRIEIVQQVKTRRAKLYFLRGRTPKQLREKLRNTVAVIKDAVVPEPKQQQEVSDSQEQERAEAEKQSELPQDDRPKQEAQETKQQQVAAETPSEQSEKPQPSDDTA